MVDSYRGAFITHGRYSAIAKDEEELPNLELFVQTMCTLENALEVEMRMSGKFSLLTVNDVDDATEDLVLEGQFVLLEGYLSSNAEEWLREMNFVVKKVQGLVAIARNEAALPETNLMYAMFAACINLPIENWAVVKKDD